MERLFTKLIVNLITIVISSVGFTLSVMAHCLAGMLPFVVNGSNTQIIHTSSLTVVAASLPDTSEGGTAIAQQVVSLQLGDAQVNFRTSVITALRHKARKASLTTAPVSPPLTDKAEHSETSAGLSSPSSLNGDHATCETEGCSEGEGFPSLVNDKEPSSKRSSLTQRIVPQVFRKRQGISQAQPIAGPSNPSKQQRPSTSPAAPQTRSRSTSPRLRMLTMKPREPEEPADAHGRIPYVPNPSGGETFQTGFVNPFKGKGKSPSTSPTSTPHKTTFALPDTQLPSPPSIIEAPVTPIPATPSPHRRHRSLASYITSAIRPSSRPTHAHSQSLSLNNKFPSSPNSRTSSPRRRSFGLSFVGASPYSSSSGASSSSSASSRSRRSFSFSSLSSSVGAGTVGEGGERETMKRTQPYGYPYFAPMPVPLARKGVSTPPVSAVKPIWEKDEVDEVPVVEDGGIEGLGLDFGRKGSAGW